MKLKSDHRSVVLVLTLITLIAIIIAIATDFEKSPTVFAGLGLASLFILTNPLEQKFLRF